MGLINQIQNDVLRFTTNLNEFAVDILLVAKTSQTLSIKGIHTKHHLGIDTDGNMVNSKKASTSFLNCIISGLLM